VQKLYSALAAWVFALTILFVPSHSRADEAEERAGKIRSALMYYLVKFVSFPSDGEHSQGTIKICLFGKDPINTVIKDIVSSKTAQSRNLEVELNAEKLSPAELQKCEVDFFGTDVGEVGLSTLRAKTAGILSVCSVSKVSWGSCMIQIFEEENKAKLAIDIELLQAAGLKVSSELLEVSLVRKAVATN
jgi:hypothetical protein